MARRHLQHHWASVGKINERDNVWRGRVRRKDPKLILIELIQNEVTAVRTEHCLVRILPLRE